MKRSTERILTTHVGSLTRPAEIVDAMRARVNNESYDRESFAEILRKGVSEVVRKPAQVGVDIVSDGEFGKSGFAVYINERLVGFERRPGEPGVGVVWQDVKPPEGTVLIPGVVTHATNLIEHPELVAERIVRLANLRWKTIRSDQAIY
jgi:methionine synthase II (cobalamin-independent)